MLKHNSNNKKKDKNNFPKLINSITQIPTGKDRFLVSYQFYNNDECEINILSNKKSKEALNILKKVGNLKNITQFRNERIDTLEVFYDGEYKKLYKNGLSEDSEIKEHKLQGTGRIFYMVFPQEKIFNLVCIREHHYETDKIRR